MSDPRYEIGKSGSVFVDDVEIRVEGWSGNEESDWQETTNSGSEGYEESIPGTMKMSGSFNGSIDLDALPVPALAAGVIVKLRLDYETGNTAVELAKAGIDSFEVTSEAKGVIKFTCNYHSIGRYEWND